MNQIRSKKRKTELFARWRKAAAWAAAAAALAAAMPAKAADQFLPGVLRHENFPNALRADVENGVVTVPATLQYVEAFEFPDSGTDNYTRRVSGFFVPATTGNYVFFLSSDDDTDLFLSTDATPANKRQIAHENAWSNALEWTASGGGSNLNQKRSDRFTPAGTTNAPFATGIALTAGSRYYIEAVHHEGGGGDNLGVTFKLAAEEDPAIGTPSALTGTVIGIMSPTAPAFVSQPVSRRALAGQNLTFSVLVDPPGSTVQWYRNDVEIPGAIELSYTHAVTAADAGARFKAIATAGNGQTGTSSNAVITLGQSVQLPFAKREFWGGGLYTRAEVADPSFAVPADSESALPTFEGPTNAADNYMSRVSALFKAPATGNYVFFVAADDDTDLFLSTDSTPANKRQIAAEGGWSAVRNWNGADGAGAGWTAAQSIAQKRSDTWIPDPVGDPTAAAPFASGIALTQGQNYYIEAVHHEGGGGDNLAVTYILKGEAAPANGAAPKITYENMAPYAQALDGGTITVVTPPQSTNGVQSRTVTLNVTARSGYVGDNSMAGPALIYQWQTAPQGSSSFTNIPNATAAAYTTPLLTLADNGRQYRVAILAGDASTNTAVGVVTVTPDTTAPRPVRVNSVNAAFNQVTVTFDELMDSASVGTGVNYSFAPGSIAGSTATLDASRLVATINTATPLTPNVENTLTITGVKDLAGNTVAANTTIKFTFQPVTYSANILFDGPLGYYRFEEASGSVAANSGTTGGDGVYYYGDEFAPGEGGSPTEAKGESGPRPPAFAGFEGGNRAATFDGFGDWVDTKNQFLQNRAAFTLEYWVKPIRTNTVDGTVWPARVGIVGQNDAVEYGFISPTSIQIWTPGGGSLDAAYNFADNEWHHVATIADGTNIKTYFDGVLAGTSGTATANYGSSTSFVHIGGGGVFDVTGNWFGGQIDEVAIFDKAISADRVAAHFKAGKEGGVITTSGAVTPGDGGGSIRLTVAGTGPNRTVSWAPAGGTLQSTPALNGAATVWTDVGAANPATVTVGADNRFYRVRQ